MEAISEREWNSLNGMCSEEAEFMAQLLSSCSLPNEVTSVHNFPISSSFWPCHESNENIAGVDESSMYSSDETNTSMYSFSQGSSYSGGGGIVFPFSSHESYYQNHPSISHQVFMGNNNLMTMDYCMMESKDNSSRVHILSTNVMEGDDFLNQDVSNDSIDSMSEDILQGKNSQLGKELTIPMPQMSKEDKCSSPTESKKRSRPHGEVSIKELSPHHPSPFIF